MHVSLKELRVVGHFCTKTYLGGEVPFSAARQRASLQRRAGIREHCDATTVGHARVLVPQVNVPAQSERQGSHASCAVSTACIGWHTDEGTRVLGTTVELGAMEGATPGCRRQSAGHPLATCQSCRRQRSVLCRCTTRSGKSALFALWSATAVSGGRSLCDTRARYIHTWPCPR